jgi:hypothetical protein
MAVALIVAELNMTSGLPEDRAVNEFVFAGPTLNDIITTVQAGNVLQDFYNAVHAPGATDLANYISNRVSRAAAAHSFKYYDISTTLDGSPHGSPFAVNTWTLDAAAALDPLPAEVSACISYHADTTGVPEEVGATRPAARRRGRLYIGPLQTGVLGTTGMLRSDFFDALRGAGIFLNAIAGLGVEWQVWSRADAAVRPVVGGFVDNAFDTQRRRGPAATLRTSWT